MEADERPPPRPQAPLPRLCSQRTGGAPEQSTRRPPGSFCISCRRTALGFSFILPVSTAFVLRPLSRPSSFAIRELGSKKEKGEE